MELEEQKRQYALEYENLMRLREKINSAINIYVADYARQDIEGKKITQIDYERLVRIIQIVEKHLPKRREEVQSKELNIAEKIIAQIKDSKLFKKRKCKIMIEDMQKRVPHFVLSSKDKRLIFTESYTDLEYIINHKYINNSYRKSKRKIDALKNLLKLLEEYDLYKRNQLVLESTNLVGEYYDSLRKLRALDRTIKQIEGHKDRSYILSEELSGEILNPDDEPRGPGVLEDYRQDSWGIERVCLDGMQNHLPYDAMGTMCWLHFEIDGQWYEVEEARKAYEQGKKITRVRFSDDGVGFSYKNLLYFHSTKSSEDRSAGQFDMALTKQQIQLLKDDLTVELAGYLVDDYHYTPQEAIDILYTSETFERLQDDATGLYYQSPGYVYSFLQNELSTAKVM